MALLVRRKLLECYVWLVDKVSRSTPMPTDPGSILIIQPGHIGDLLVNTPLFEALHRKYPSARLSVAAGPWNAAAVENNPFVAEFIPLACPWNNMFVKPQGLLAAMKFIRHAPEVQALAPRRFDIGIDLLGTQFDVLLMMKIGVGYRIGIRGGGHGFSAMHQWVRHDFDVRMGTMALQLARLLGANDAISTRPQIFLTDAERAAGEALWSSQTNPTMPRKRRLVVAPAAGMPHRCWPHENYIKTVAELATDGNLSIVLVGGNDAAEICGRIAAAAPAVQNQCGKLALRQTFGLIAAADATLSNSNVVLHAASSFGVPALVVLSTSTPTVSVEEKLWGHDTARMFGISPGHPGIYTPAEMVPIIRQVLNGQASEFPKTRTTLG
jgi:heptosyltransferase-2